jgi:ParB/RepB/Spo0J family partition protein
MKGTPLELENPKNYSTRIDLPCSKLKDHPLRIDFYSQAHIERLSASIENHGLLQPLLVSPLPNGDYQILSGHYRIRALRRLRESKCPCMIYEGDKLSMLKLYCTANLFTRALNPIEEAHMIAGLIKDEGLTMKEIGELFAHDKSWVSKRLKLIRYLDPHIKELVAKGKISPRLAEELARLPQGNQERVFGIIKKRHMNKDEASRFISWWIGATEDERDRAEDYHDGIQNNLTLTSEAKLVERAIRNCRLSLDKIIDIIMTNSNVPDWWPSSSFKALESSFDTVSRMLR